MDRLNRVSQQIADAFRLAHRASEDDTYSPEARNMFRQVARKIWEAHGTLANTPPQVRQ